MTHQAPIPDGTASSIPGDIQPELVIVKDTQGRIVFANQAAARCLGVTDPAQLLGRTEQEFHPDPDTQARLAEEQASLRSGLAIAGRDIRLPGCDGRPVTVRLSSTPLRDAHGQITGLISLGQETAAPANPPFSLLTLDSTHAAALDLLPVLLFEIDRDATIVNYRASHTESLYIAPQNFLSKQLRDVLPAAASAAIPEALEKARSTGQHASIVYPLSTPSGDRWYEAIIAPRQDTPQGEERFVALIHDITARKQVEVRLREMLARELEQRMRAETLTGLVLTLTAHSTLNDVLAEILDQMHALIAHDIAKVSLLQGQIIKVARWSFASGSPVRLPPENEQYPLGFLPIEAEIIQTCTPVVIADAREEPRWVWLDGQDWIRSYMALPIQSQGRVIGLMSMLGSQPGLFDAADIEHLQPFVSAAAIAIENAQLHESARQEIARREQAERALRQAYDQLENQVQARTFELANANNVLQAQMAERERIERALRESEELYRAAVQQSHDAIYLMEDRRVILVNQAFERIFGFSAEEVTSPEFEAVNLAAPEHRASLLARSEARTGGWPPASRYEIRAMKKNGQTFEAEVHVTQIELGGRTLRQGILRDITERKQALQALHESEDRFRSAFNNTPIGMAILDLDGRCIQVNSAMCQILGYTEAEIKTLDFRQLAIPGEHDTVVDYWQQIRQGTLDAYRQEGQYLHKAGHIVWALTSASAVHDDRGQPLHVIVQLNDITSRIQAEENLEQLLETLQQRNRQLITAAEVSKWANANLDQQTLIERVVDLIRDGFNFYYVGLFLCDEAREFAVLRAGTGEAGRRMLIAGHKLDIGGESMIGQCVRHALPRIALKAREEPIRFDNPLLPGTRSEMALPLNTLTGCIGALTVHSAQEAAFTEEDVTILQSMVDQVAIAIENARLYRAAQDEIVRRQAIEAEIIQLNASLERRVRERTAELEAANRELETFSYSVSHDLRAPLRSINGFSQALLEDYGDLLPVEGQDYLKRVRAASQRMSQLIDDILDLSRVTRAEMQRETVSLSTLAQAIAAELLANQPERRVEFVIQPGLEAYADPQLLQIVLENLLSNAWKFTSKHAQAHIEFGQTRVDGVPAYFVRDDGAGFDRTYASKMFMPFQRLHAVTEFEGNGIGLATVQRIIHRHGGRVWAEGAVERGATFYFTLI